MRTFLIAFVSLIALAACNAPIPGPVVDVNVVEDATPNAERVDLVEKTDGGTDGDTVQCVCDALGFPVDPNCQGSCPLSHGG